MKINYIAHLDPFFHKGGGEVVLSQLLETGKERGHEFGFRTCSPYNNTLYNDQDLTFLADLFNCPGNQPSFSKSEIFSFIESGPYIHFDNAYVDICDLDYLPCNGNNQYICPHKGIRSWKSHVKKKTLSKKCFANNDIVKKIYSKSKVNYFVSPLHRSVISRVLNLDEAEGRILIPLIDTKKFWNKNSERIIDNLFVGVIGEAKGLSNMEKIFHDQSIVLIGKSITGKKPDFGEWLGHIDYSMIPEYMNKSKNFIFLPRWPEPQGRVVAEAALCGCNLILNENVGAYSFKFDLSESENYLNAKNIFWQEIENIF